MKYAIVLLEETLNLGLNSTDKLLLGMIISLTSKRAECTANNGYFAKHLELSKRTISKTLAKLEKKNLISIKMCNSSRIIYSNIGWKNNSMGMEEYFYTP